MLAASERGCASRDADRIPPPSTCTGSESGPAGGGTGHYGCCSFRGSPAYYRWERGRRAGSSLHQARKSASNPPVVHQSWRLVSCYSEA